MNVAVPGTISHLISCVPTIYTQSMNSLNKRHRLFVEAYAGDVLEAMKIAGWSGHEEHLTRKGNELLRQPLILDAIKHRTKYVAKTKKAIASKEDRQEWWSKLMFNKDPNASKGGFDKHGNPLPEDYVPEVPMSARLKASELLGKSEGDFVDRIDIDANVSLTEIVMQSYKKDEEDDMSLEEIEAEYYRVRDDNEGGEESEDESLPDELPEIEYHEEDDTPDYSFI